MIGRLGDDDVSTMMPAHGPSAAVTVQGAGVRGNGNGKGKGRLPWWGWVEWTVLAQTAIPALMFVPALTPIRTYTRVASFALALLAWGAVVVSGRRSPGRPFPASPWLAVCAVWLAVSVAHPTTNSIASGVAQAALNIAILSPALWAGAALRTPRQIGRVVALLFLCNAASALVGIGQFYRPETFNPPVIPVFNMADGIENMLSFETADGRRVIRPCGLTDVPGAASGAGLITCLVGLCFALRPMAGWKRLASLALAMAGAAVIYLSQVRSSLLTLVLCLGALVGLFLVRGDRRRATLLALGGAGIIGSSLLWVSIAGGQGALRRFESILEASPTELYQGNRGKYLEETLTRYIWEYPFGAGLGRWGQIFASFGDKSPSVDRGPLWAEVQATAWTYDGGIPLIALYSIAIILGVWDSIRIVRRCRDEEVGYWAMAICALGLSVLTLCFNGCPFIGPLGVQFWLLLAALHAADQQSRRATA